MKQEHSTSDIRHSTCMTTATSATLADSRLSRRGFTLIEMLTVIVLIGILMAAVGLSVRKANELSKNTKAEAECRELVNALLEYRATLHAWPVKNPSSGPTDVSRELLGPLVDSSKNPRGLVFLNLTLAEGTWNDPWGKPYKVHFPDSSNLRRPSAIEACVSFPFRRPFRQPSPNE